MDLIEARKNARYSQADVAGHLGISRPTYAKMEASPETVTIEDAKKLSKLFGVKVEDIFFRETCS
jgi:DNA-binding XRE family transcriptional regulator